MTNNLHAFSQRCLTRAKNIEDNVVLVQKDIAAPVLEKLVWRTPVDTSKALSNWVVSSDIALSDERSAYMEGKHKSTWFESAEATIEFGKEMIAEHVDGDLHITNNASYIQDLNAGWSPQAGAGFVTSAIGEVLQSGAVHRSLLAIEKGEAANV